MKGPYCLSRTVSTPLSPRGSVSGFAHTRARVVFERCCRLPPAPACCSGARGGAAPGARGGRALGLCRRRRFVHPHRAKAAGATPWWTSCGLQSARERDVGRGRTSGRSDFAVCTHIFDAAETVGRRQRGNGEHVRRRFTVNFVIRSQSRLNNRLSCRPVERKLISGESAF